MSLKEKGTFIANMKKELASGKDRKQALAIANAVRSKSKGMAHGGMVDDDDDDDFLTAEMDNEDYGCKDLETEHELSDEDKKKQRLKAIFKR